MNPSKHGYEAWCEAFPLQHGWQQVEPERRRTRTNGRQLASPFLRPFGGGKDQNHYTRERQAHHPACLCFHVHTIGAELIAAAIFETITSGADIFKWEFGFRAGFEKCQRGATEPKPDPTDVCHGDARRSKSIQVKSSQFRSKQIKWLNNVSKQILLRCIRNAHWQTGACCVLPHIHSAVNQRRARGCHYCTCPPLLRSSVSSAKAHSSPGAAFSISLSKLLL